MVKFINQNGGVISIVTLIFSLGSTWATYTIKINNIESNTDLLLKHLVEQSIKTSYNQDLELGTTLKSTQSSQAKLVQNVDFKQDFPAIEKTVIKKVTTANPGATDKVLTELILKEITLNNAKSLA